MIRTLTADQARRLSLGAQGFGRPRPSGRVDKRHLRRAMNDMQCLQLDSVNVCVRSHYMPFFSRLGPYRSELIDELAYKDREYFEYWGHEASFIPIERYPDFGHRRQEMGSWPAIARLEAEHPGYIDQVEAEVRRDGPLSTGDLERTESRAGSWWGWNDGKIALEYLFAKGRLGISKRVNFTRHYTAPSDVIPADLLSQPSPPRDESYRLHTLSALRALGVGTKGDIANYWRMKQPLLAPVLKAMVAGGDIEEVEVRGWGQPAYMLPGTSIPRRIEARALLTPFDPVVWAPRDRSERIHGFDYTIEIYTPEPRRVFGYYVYPFLLGDTLVGRVDLKTDRAAGRLLVQASWIEDDESPDRVAPELAAELRLMATWLGMNEVEVGGKGNLHERLGRELSR